MLWRSAAADAAAHIPGFRAGLAPEVLVYRQLMYRVVIQSVATALYGLRLRWQTLSRTGELDAAPVSALSS